MAGHIKCLQQNLDNAEMGEDCKKEVVRDMARSAEGMCTLLTVAFGCD